MELKTFGKKQQHGIQDDEIFCTTTFGQIWHQQFRGQKFHLFACNYE